MAIRLRTDAPFFETKFIYSRLMVSVFHLMLLSLSKIVSCGVQKLKGKQDFRKIEIIHMWQFVSSVAQKRNPANVINSSRIWTMFSNGCSQKSDIVRLLIIGILKKNP